MPTLDPKLAALNNQLPTVGQNTVDINSALATGGLKQPGVQPTLPTASNTALTPGQFNNTPLPTEPVKTPAPVISTGPATKVLDQAKQTIATTDQQNLDAKKKMDEADLNTPNTSPTLLGSNKPNPAYVAPKPEPVPVETPEDKLAKLPAPGMQEAYNTVTGAREDKPVGQLPTGFVAQNPLTRTDAESITDANSTTFKKFSDGTYGRFDRMGNYVPSSATEFNNAKNINDLQQAVTDAKKGIYSTDQQSQLDATAKMYQDIINKQVGENTNMAYGINAAARGAGYLTSANIVQSFKAGLERVVSLTDAMNKALADMKRGFTTDDINLLDSSWTQYKSSQDAVQKQIDTMHSAAEKAQEKQDTILQNFAINQTKLHPNAGIDGTETSIQQIQDKVNKSESELSRYANAQQPTPETRNVYDSLINSTPGAVWQDALTYANIGPSALSGMGLGQSSQVQAYRNAVKAQASAIASSLGVDEYQLRAMFKANSSAVTQNIQRLSRVESITNSIVNQMPRLASLADEVKASGINVTESDLQATQADIERRFGNTPAAQYLELVQTIRADYAANNAALAGSRGGEFFAKSANSAIPVGLSGDQYNAIKDTMVTSTQNIRDGIGSEVTRLMGEPAALDYIKKNQSTSSTTSTTGTNVPTSTTKIQTKAGLIDPSL